MLAVGLGWCLFGVWGGGRGGALVGGGVGGGGEEFCVVGLGQCHFLIKFNLIFLGLVSPFGFWLFRGGGVGGWWVVAASM